MHYNVVGCVQGVFGQGAVPVALKAVREPAAGQRARSTMQEHGSIATAKVYPLTETIRAKQ